MAEKKAELYRNPNAKLMRAGDLKTIVDEFKSLTSALQRQYFIKYDGEIYRADEVNRLKID
jgi:hypothetical protein